MNSVLRTFLGLLLFSLAFSFQSFSQTYLKTQGKIIVNEAGEEVILRGMGLGGWMLQEGYMMQMNAFANPQREIEAKILEVLGATKKEEFYQKWLANYIRKVDIDSLAAWGFNSIRLPMHYKWYTKTIEDEPVPGQNTWLEGEGQGFALTDSLVKWCKANNMYVILDMHAAPGGQGKDEAISDYDPSKPSLWESEANRQKLVALWRKLAEKYKDEPTIAGYDFINEINWGFTNLTTDKHGCTESSNKPLKDLYKRLIDTVRLVDSKHMVFIEGNCWGNNHNGLWPITDNNVVMSFHKYWNYNDQASIQGLLNLSTQYNVPLWLGESGENSNTWFTNAIKLVEDNHIGWAWWTVKKFGLNTPMEVRVSPGFRSLLDYWGGKAPKPTEEQAYTNLMGVIEDIKFENTFHHMDIIDAMFRQVNSNETLPFKPHNIINNAIVYAADYDFGRNGRAYFDRDTADYHSVTSKFQAWNNGWAYRNDGVDIEVSKDTPTNGYNVGWTDNGEWLKYTVNVAAGGVYSLKVRTASTNDRGRLTIYSNGYPATDRVKLPNTTSYTTFQNTEIQDVYLPAGKNELIVRIDTGGFNINFIQFSGPSVPTASQQPKLFTAKASADGKQITLSFNRTFQAIPSEHGFKLKVNGQDASIASVNLLNGNAQIVVINLTNPVYFGDEAYVSYAGTGVKTTEGAVLSVFADKLVLIDANGIVTIPGRIEAENFVVNSGFQIEATTDAGGGSNVGHTDSGDYLDYAILVKEAGDFTVDFRIAGSGTSAKSLKLQLIDGAPVDLATVQFTGTGDWQKWATVSSGKISLTKGVHKIRVLATSAGFNFNWLEFKKSTTTSADKSIVGSISVFPNPSKGHFKVSLKNITAQPTSIYIQDVTGKVLTVVKPLKGAKEVEVVTEVTKGLYLLVVEVKTHKIVKKIFIE